MEPTSAQSELWQAARDRVVWADASAREALRVTGPDRASFVHGMVTNDVEGLKPGESNFAALLTPKGAMVGYVRVLARADELIIDCEPGCGQVVREALGKFLISEDAELADAPEFAVVSLIGPERDAWAVRLGGEKLVTEPNTQVDVLIPRARLDEVTALLASVPKLDEATREVLRVEAGVPKWGADLTTTTIPLEANLSKAIHYQKGCYIGQEVIARATFRGQMARRLVSLSLAEPVAAGAELTRDGKKVGWVTSVVRSELTGEVIALAYVHRDSLAVGTALQLPSAATATVTRAA